MELANNRKLLRGIYRHFKGKRYLVLHCAEHTETGEQMVVYQALYGTGAMYVRPLEMLLGDVDKVKYPNASQKYRFEFMGDM